MTEINDIELEEVSGGKKSPFFIYRVKSGDTLSGIAFHNHTTVQELLRLNRNITNPDRIELNQKILIPRE